MLKTGAIAAVVAAVVLAGAPAAFAARPTPAQAPDTVTSAHFVVHYKALDPATPLSTANAVSADAEAGYTMEVTQFGYPTPLTDGDGKTDIYVYSPEAKCVSCNGFTEADSVANQASAWIYVNPPAALNHSTVPHELFHVIQLGIYQPQLQNQDLATESSASWIGALASGSDGGHTPIWARAGDRGSTLDCLTPGCSTSESIYGQWPFYQAVRERFGDYVTFDRDVFQRSAAVNAGPRQFASMDEVLAGKGSSLPDVVLGYAKTVGAGNWASALLQGRAPSFSAAATLGVNANTSTSQTDTLDHLATRYYKLSSNACNGTCDAALHVGYGWPAGAPVKATLAGAGTQIPVTSGATGATADLPFNNGTEYVLGLTNVSETANGVPISLQANAARNASAPSGGTTSTPGTTPPPPPPPGPPPVPALTLAGKVKVAKGRASRVVVFTLNSSATGFVTVTLTTGGAKLVAHTAAKASRFSRTLAVSPGANRFRFALSKRVRKGRYAVILTPASAAGQIGTPITAGKVSVPKAPKKKRKARRAGPVRVY